MQVRRVPASAWEAPPSTTASSASCRLASSACTAKLVSVASLFFGCSPGACRFPLGMRSWGPTHSPPQAAGMGRAQERPGSGPGAQKAC